MAIETQTMAGRRVAGVIDAGGVYTSLVAAGGDYAFFASTAVGPDGGLPDEVRIRPPYRGAAATARAQAHYIFGRYRELLAEVGSSIEDIVQIEQYFLRKAYVDGYTQTARGPGYMDKNRPGSMITELGEYIPEGAVVNTTGLAIIPDPERGMVKEIPKPVAAAGMRHPGEDGAAQPASRGHSQIVAAGPYAFSTFTAIDYETGLLPEVVVPMWAPHGSEVRAEAQATAKAIGDRVEATGATWADVVNYTLILPDIDDLYEFDLVFKDVLGDAPPSRTVTPIAAMAMGRREGMRGHEDNVATMEIQFRWARPGHGGRREVVSTGAPLLGVESEATKAGDLLWISNMVAGGPEGPIADLSPRSQLDHLVERLEAVCAAGGTSLDNLLRVRAFVLSRADGYAVYAAIKRAIPENPPAVCVSIVPAPLQVPGCTVLLDGVAWVPAG